MFRLPRLMLAVLFAVALLGVEAKKPKVSTKNSKQAAQLQVSRYPSFPNLCWMSMSDHL